MTRTILLLIYALFAATTVSANDGSERFIERFDLANGQSVIVEEGILEARSIGSFTIRLYAAAPPGDDTTFFLDGLVVARQGTIEAVKFADVDCDKNDDIIVVSRSVGTGGYLSVYAFKSEDNHLIAIKTEEGLLSDADPVGLIKCSFGDVEKE